MAASNCVARERAKKAAIKEKEDLIERLKKEGRHEELAAIKKIEDDEKQA